MSAGDTSAEGLSPESNPQPCLHPSLSDRSTLPGAPSIVVRTQRGLESLYRVDTQLDVREFLIDESCRREAGPARTPREQLLIRTTGEDADLGVGLGLFLDPAAMHNLERHDPASRLDSRNFSDFCLVVEGVSHFVYFALCAAADRPVSALELELQAEVDKFVCCVLLSAAQPPANEQGGGVRGSPWSRLLYDDITFADDLDADEKDRYRTANCDARRYAQSLSRQYIDCDRLASMLPELRQFYRMDLDDKRAHIARTARGAG
jgi:hypothetical protein